MEQEPRKQWPIFLFVGVLLVAGVLKLQAIFSPADSSVDAAASEVATRAEGTVAANFGQADWTIATPENPDLSSTPQMKSYRETDLQVGADASPVAIRQYATDLKYALQPYSNPKLKSEVQATMDVYEVGTEGSSDAVATLETSKSNHTVALAALLNTTVPQLFLPYHLALVNSVARMGYLTGNMQRVQIEPLLALTSARIFGPEAERFAKALQTINNALLLSGVQFSANDGMQIYINVSR